MEKMLEIFSVTKHLYSWKNYWFIWFSREKKLKMYFKEVQLYSIDKISPKQCIKFSTPANRVVWKGSQIHDTQRHRILHTFRYFSAFNCLLSLRSLSLMHCERVCGRPPHTVIERDGNNSLRPKRVTVRGMNAFTLAIHRITTEMKWNRPFCYSHLSSAALSNIHFYCWMCCKIQFFFLFSLSFYHI